MNLFGFFGLLNGTPPAPETITAAIADTEAALTAAALNCETAQREVEVALLEGNSDAVKALRSRLTVATDERDSQQLGLDRLRKRLAEAEDAEHRARVDGKLDRGNKESERGVEIIRECGLLFDRLAEHMTDLDVIEDFVAAVNEEAAEADHEGRVPSPNELVRTHPDWDRGALPPLPRGVVLPSAGSDEVGVWPVGVNTYNLTSRDIGLFEEHAACYVRERAERVTQLLRE